MGGSASPSLTAPCPLSPDELELVEPEGESRIRARQSLPAGLCWGPYHGNIHGEPASPEQNETVRTPSSRNIWVPAPPTLALQAEPLTPQPPGWGARCLPLPQEHRTSQPRWVETRTPRGLLPAGLLPDAIFPCKRAGSIPLH